MKKLLKTYDELTGLLYSLDEKLAEQFGEDFSVTIQAVGGYALMFHGLRVTRNLSRDIDSMTELPAKVYRIAQDLDSSGWLNDDVSADYGIPEKFKNNLVFVDSMYKFKCINLQIAVLESLMAMKLHAIDNMTQRGYDKNTNPRTQDPSDVKEILRLYGVKNEQDFVKEFPGLDCYIEKKLDENIFEKYKLFE
ncbi:MAG: hypothetical protein LBI27_04475 [Clostridiales bacterium]|jgi:hypothetical protein|nr:hypothetical protein [Clostridiales bacterium]